MHLQLSDALAVVMRELSRGDVARPTISDDDWSGDEDRAGAMLGSPDGSGWGVAVTLDQSPAAQLVDLADQVQEWAVEELWRLGRPAVWPECPHHRNSHPLAPRLVGDTASWVCPSDSEVVCGIGVTGARSHA